MHTILSETRGTSRRHEIHHGGDNTPLAAAAAPAAAAACSHHWSIPGIQEVAAAGTTPEAAVAEDKAENTLQKFKFKN